jgi:hypothetical protein
MRLGGHQDDGLQLAESAAGSLAIKCYLRGPDTCPMTTAFLRHSVLPVAEEYQIAVLPRALPNFLL